MRLSPLQMELYEEYLKRMGQTEGQVTAKGGRLFSDYQNLMKIWTHPWMLKLDEIRQLNKVSNIATYAFRVLHAFEHRFSTMKD